MSPVFALFAACTFTVIAMSTDAQPKPNAATADAVPATATGKPLIVRNPDGTVTVQKEAAPEKPGTAGRKGLVISPQVIVPAAPAPSDKQGNQER